MNLVDVNDEPPIFSSPFGYNVLVDENIPVNSVIRSQVILCNCGSRQQCIIPHVFRLVK